MLYKYRTHFLKKGSFLDHHEIKKKKPKQNWIMDLFKSLVVCSKIADFRLSIVAKMESRP
jgi:hypothetical protein